MLKASGKRATAPRKVAAARERWQTASQLSWPDTACRATKGGARDNVIRVSPRLRREGVHGET
jgi:hypothetical protein